MGENCHAVIILGAGKPSEHPNFTFEGSRLETRASAGVLTFLQLRELLRQRNVVGGSSNMVALILSGAFDEALLMARYTRTRLALAGLSPEQISASLVVESVSRTTVENARCCSLLDAFDVGTPLHAIEDLQVWLVTTLSHLPRSRMLFQTLLPNAKSLVAVPACGGSLTSKDLMQLERDATHVKADQSVLSSARQFATSIMIAEQQFSCTMTSSSSSCEVEGNPEHREELEFLQRRKVSAIGYSSLSVRWKKMCSLRMFLSDNAHIAWNTESPSVQHPVFFGDASNGAKEISEWCFIPVKGNTSGGEKGATSSWCWLTNRHHPHLRVHVQQGEVVASSNVPDHWSSAKWRRVATEPHDHEKEELHTTTGNEAPFLFRVENQWLRERKHKSDAEVTDQHLCLHVQHSADPRHTSFGRVSCGPVQPGWSSALWTVDGDNVC